jgi:hypothetical protein
VVGERSEQAGAIAGGYAVCAVAEFGEQVQHSLRYRPAEGKVAGDFGGGVVGNKQDIGPGWIRRCRTELIMPQAEPAPAAQFPGDQAHGLRILAGVRAELKVKEPNLPERKCSCPARRFQLDAPAICRRARRGAGSATGARVGRPATCLQRLHC